MTTLKITVEADELDQPVIFVREVRSWRIDTQTGYHELTVPTFPEHKKYEPNGQGTLTIEWRE